MGTGRGARTRAVLAVAVHRQASTKRIWAALARHAEKADLRELRA
jgi:hypothetical protein